MRNSSSAVQDSGDYASARYLLSAICPVLVFLVQLVGAMLRVINNNPMDELHPSPSIAGTQPKTRGLRARRPKQPEHPIPKS
ncbi:hypothetical protein BU26DRAFT_218684 [Trematosphaeria pertusa]|uniref:Uncharacterized protein n=1 Tax=Trematosphaeria pertusa TaxID=390896 RepID=A0A6A6IRS4_9PLEO|nr:uncharacterized protein BU26DRAFT_218684 [Trematosphaeria pertusa]KAF2253234.1 hypothetical protein BU26DRAFT_218684 [Trematosphaeria pertusa]